MKTFGEVVQAFEDARVDVRDAYWGFPHRKSDGDLELVLVRDGVEHHVVSVTAADGRIIVVIE